MGEGGGGGGGTLYPPGLHPPSPPTLDPEPESNDFEPRHLTQEVLLSIAAQETHPRPLCQYTNRTYAMTMQNKLHGYLTIL